jgi:hypothetical protein
MAKSDTVDVSTITIGGITVKRWWRSKEIWNYIVGAVTTVIALVAVLAPNVLPLLPTLNLSPGRMLAAVVVLNLAVQINGMILKMRSTAMIGNKVEVAEAKSVNATEPAEHGGQ